MIFATTTTNLTDRKLIRQEYHNFYISSQCIRGATNNNLDIIVEIIVVYARLRYSIHIFYLCWIKKKKEAHSDHRGFECFGVRQSELIASTLMAFTWYVYMIIVMPNHNWKAFIIQMRVKQVSLMSIEYISVFVGGRAMKTYYSLYYLSRFCWFEWIQVRTWVVYAFIRVDRAHSRDVSIEFNVYTSIYREATATMTMFSIIKRYYYVKYGITSRICMCKYLHATRTNAYCVFILKNHDNND